MGGMTPGTFFPVSRNWSEGDTLVVYLHMSLRVEWLNDNRPAFATMGAIMYGPLLLAAISPPPTLNTTLCPAGPPDHPSMWLSRAAPTATYPLLFSASIRGQELLFAPLYRIMGDSYTVYFNFSCPAL
eukprot:NODE_2598_length_575_cov_189.716730_g2225_i0.p2 GENE.NODE_2598_length_575_cov_189.716730_g2225_i0~~NODE_2598_length_575_cov_189.716730_g2225_i0.p2  ORF type:complete len:137 (-),score=17.40 NODE_2598_length_575_cov_189.716730_g2225_i0:163-546(-)